MSHFLASFVTFHCMQSLIIQDYAHNAFHRKAGVTFVSLLQKHFVILFLRDLLKPTYYITQKYVSFILYSECVLLHILVISISTLWLSMPTKSGQKVDFQVVENALISKIMKRPYVRLHNNNIDNSRKYVYSFIYK